MKHLVTCLMAFSLLGASLAGFAADKPPAAATPDLTIADEQPASPGITPPALSVIPEPLLPRVRIQTNLGYMTVELYEDKAPITVANFLGYVREGNYDQTIFHRVVSNFIIQGGVYSPAYEPRFTKAAIVSESNNGLKNERGTLAMAREYDPNSATSQFFINVQDNRILNYHSPRAGHWGYTVFGKVVAGLDVLDKIRNLPTGTGGPFTKELPTIPVIIQKISMEPSAPRVILASAAPLVPALTVDEVKAKADTDAKKTPSKVNKKESEKDRAASKKPQPTAKKTEKKPATADAKQLPLKQVATDIKADKTKNN